MDNCRQSLTLSTDDVLMGEILISLKRNAVVQPPPASSSSSLPLPLPPMSYRSNNDLTVQAPIASTTHFSFQHQQFAPLASPFRPLATTVSPVASSERYTAPSAHSPTERSKRFGPVVELADLRQCFNMPIAAVARKFGICATLLKKICRRHGIQRWPHRQIRSLQKSIDMLRESLAVAKGSNKDYIAKKIAAFEYTLECIMKDPNTAAKGISAGRLASPASDEHAKRNSVTPPAAAAASPIPTTATKTITSSLALAAALSEDDAADDMMDGSNAAAAPPLMHVWSPSTSPSASMSLKSILC